MASPWQRHIGRFAARIQRSYRRSNLTSTQSQGQRECELKSIARTRSESGRGHVTSNEQLAAEHRRDVVDRSPLLNV
jgi:hypothetical protein